ncbi:flavin monoamine oxidase family protein [Capillimicrobium parvum]|uniref:Putrescine oxidase n=1 Tax=Capillimicrobium parvum TaxID=2884022 RepID=A0A9E7C214_9ACTN|nr:FAD-dependent oxidoreductase [Capillimicrobium parvum]UGS37259.1 Putrescine oxidase [Capillimicrobium parvum]
MTLPALPERADVVVVGAGISGLVAARRLAAAGVDVAVVEARDRVGGRLKRVVTPSGRVLEAGGELVGEHMASIRALADELGVPIIPMGVGEGQLVRYHEGERLLEAFPYEKTPDSGAALHAATKALDAMAAQVPIEDPWNAPRAAEWDAQTLLQWVDANVADPGARAGLAAEFYFMGGAFEELSLLFCLWTLHAMGLWEQWEMGTSHRLQGGTSDLVTRVAEPLRDRIFEQAPVRRVEHAAGGVTVHTDRGAIRAEALVVAIAPALCPRIEWEPRLPPARDRLQDRYLMGHGIKFQAIYDEPWWREKGYMGLGLGQDPVWVLVDATGPDDEGAGRLVGFAPITGRDVARWSDVMGDEEAAKQLFVEQVGNYFGDGPAPVEVHLFSWVGDPWSLGCGTGLGCGTLSTVGPSLRAPIGPIVWAGAETGLPQNDWIEGAISAGERASREALERVGAAAG